MSLWTFLYVLVSFPGEKSVIFHSEKFVGWVGGIAIIESAPGPDLEIWDGDGIEMTCTWPGHGLDPSLTIVLVSISPFFTESIKINLKINHSTFSTPPQQPLPPNTINFPPQLISTTESWDSLPVCLVTCGDHGNPETSVSDEIDHKTKIGQNTRFFLKIFSPAHFDHWKLR